MSGFGGWTRGGSDVNQMPHPSRLRGPGFLQTAFEREQSKLLATLRSSDNIVHDGDRGDNNEEHSIAVFKHYLPTRYTVDKAAALDITGQTSDSIDPVPRVGLLLSPCHRCPRNTEGNKDT